MGHAIAMVTGCLVAILIATGHPWEGVALILGWALGAFSAVLIEEFGD